jgi:hypothetical protein
VPTEASHFLHWLCNARSNRGAFRRPVPATAHEDAARKAPDRFHDNLVVFFPESETQTALRTARKTAQNARSLQRLGRSDREGYQPDRPAVDLSQDRRNSRYFHTVWVVFLNRDCHASEFAQGVKAATAKTYFIYVYKSIILALL